MRSAVVAASIVSPASLGLLASAKGTSQCSLAANGPARMARSNPVRLLVTCHC